MRPVQTSTRRRAVSRNRSSHPRRRHSRTAVASTAVFAALFCGCISVDSTPVQLSAASPVQLFDEGSRVSGVRLAALWAHNERVDGLDIAGAAATSRGRVRGVQLSGVANLALGGITGVQFAWISNRAGTLEYESWDFANTDRVFGADLRDTDAVTGAQIAAVNQGKVTGAQVGLLNHAPRLGGLQLGIVNYSGELDGLQIGLLNFSPDGFLPVFPLFNYDFD